MQMLWMDLAAGSLQCRHSPAHTLEAHALEAYRL